MTTDADKLRTITEIATSMRVPSWTVRRRIALLPIHPVRVAGGTQLFDGDDVVDQLRTCEPALEIRSGRRGPQRHGARR